MFNFAMQYLTLLALEPKQQYFATQTCNFQITSNFLVRLYQMTVSSGDLAS